MAFNDYSFVQCKMSSAVETVLNYDDYQPEGIEFVLDTLASEGHKVSIRCLNEGHTFSVSLTGGKDTANQGLIISTFGDTLDSAFKKLGFLLTLQPKGSKNWLSIPDTIKEAERTVNAMLQEYMKR